MPVDSEDDLTFTVANPSGASTINWVKITPGGVGVQAVSDGGADGWTSTVSGTSMIFSGGTLAGGQSQQFGLTVNTWSRFSDGAVTWAVLASDNGGTTSVAESAAFPGALTLDTHALGANYVEVTAPNGITDDTATQGQTITLGTMVTNYGGAAVNYHPVLTSSNPSDQVSTIGVQTIQPGDVQEFDFSVTLGPPGTRTFTSTIAGTWGGNYHPGLNGELTLVVESAPTFSLIPGSLWPTSSMSGGKVTFHAAVAKTNVPAVRLDPAGTKIEIRSAGMGGPGAVIMSASLDPASRNIGPGNQTAGLTFNQTTVPQLYDGSYATSLTLAGVDENGKPLPSPQTITLPSFTVTNGVSPFTSATLSGPVGQLLSPGVPAIKDGDVVTLSGPIRTGPGLTDPLDTTASIVSCSLVILDSTAAVEVSRRPIPNCTNSGGNLTGSITASSLGVTKGFARIELVIRSAGANQSITPPVQESGLAGIDNQTPTIDKAWVDCGPMITLPNAATRCDDLRAIRVLFTEPITTTYTAADFKVTNPTHQVLRADPFDRKTGGPSSCAASGMCDGVLLTLDSDLLEHDLPRVEYTFVSAPIGARLRDAAGGQLANTAKEAEEQFLDDDVATETPPTPTRKPGTKAALLERSAPGSVLVVTANVKQIYSARRQTKNSCPNRLLHDGSSKRVKKASPCASDRREEAFAKRIKELGGKLLVPPDATIPPDGIGGKVPDLILLQEVRCEDARKIRDHLWDHLQVKMSDSGAQPRALYQVFGCMESGPNNPETDAGSTTKNELTVPIKKSNDTAILMLTQTMTPIELAPGQPDRGRGVVAQYGPDAISNECTQDPTQGLGYIDAGAGANGCHVRYQRAWIQGFRELDGSASVAAASIHHPSSLQTGALSEEQRDLYVRHWSEKIADYMRRRYDSRVSHLVLAGDHNMKRCPPPPSDQLSEPVVCEQRQWWTAMTGADPARNNRTYQFGDAVYDRVVAEGQADLRPQYVDGCANFDLGACQGFFFRSKRIDYIFDRPTANPPTQTPTYASHDLSCGITVKFDPGRRHCDHLRNPERYSDHRLVWAYVGGGPQPTP